MPQKAQSAMGIHLSLEGQGGLDKEVICKLTEKITGVFQASQD